MKQIKDHGMVYRRITLVVASPDCGDPSGESIELAPVILNWTLSGGIANNLVKQRYRSDGILVLDVDEVPLHLAEVEAI
jgi:hypothetical protein